jgi:M6 family metalloprotease-like protein
MPQQVRQPNGLVINCFVSGDEFYNWLHDSLNYTIILDSKTGYYCYAMKQNDVLVPSKFIAGIDNPGLTSIHPGLQFSSAQILKTKSQYLPDIPEKKELTLKSSSLGGWAGTLNNIVIYVRFADQPEFEPKQAIYESYFNSSDSGANSMYNYFNEVSYQKLKIISRFYPKNDGTHIISYQDKHRQSFYCPKTEMNDSGYTVVNGGQMMKDREYALVRNAIKAVRKQLPSDLSLDINNDYKVDNLCFIVRGRCFPPECAYSTLLWPHAYRFFNSAIVLNSKTVYKYNFQIESYLDSNRVGVLCHEMFHIIGGGDLYRCNTELGQPVGRWDLMACTTNPPQSMCVASKERYGGWIKEIPEITKSGHYKLNPINSETDNCYKLPLSKKEYLILEFRQKKGTFESSIPGTGLIIYRINIMKCCNNLDNPEDYIYIYRPDTPDSIKTAVNKAYFDSSVGQSTFHNTSNPVCILSDGSLGNIFIKNIKVEGDFVSFDVRFCDETDVLISNIDKLPSILNARNMIKTSGSVLVNSWEHVVFEAANEIELNPGFEVQLGGQFETNINYCGNP